MLEFLTGVGVIAGLIVGFLVINFMFRVVVATNMVHIVQSKTKTTSYGTGQEGGNVYMNWPAQFPFIGITVSKLPVSNFNLSLESYEAYDEKRVPFVVDVTAFFRIKDTSKAAQRIAEPGASLHEQLSELVQGAVRRVLASDNVDSIMLERSKFGDLFTNEVRPNLEEWGLEPVKSLELKDVRDGLMPDGSPSKVIANIMAKQTSQIERESRVVVAENNRAAEMAEIEARREVDIQRQQAEQAVGERTAAKTQAVGVADEQARQLILDQKRETEERDMAVKRVTEVRTAEIEKDKQVVAAEQDKQTTVIIADGQLEAKRKEAAGVEALGLAEAAARKAMELAPVQAAIELADKIGENPAYQQYLQAIEAIKAYLVVGQEQAKALQGADVKVIANTGSTGEGVRNVMDLFSAKGGTHLGAAVEAFAQTPLGKSLMERVVAAQAAPTVSTAPAAEAPAAAS